MGESFVCPFGPLPLPGSVSLYLGGCDRAGDRANGALSGVQEDGECQCIRPVGDTWYRTGRDTPGEYCYDTVVTDMVSLHVTSSFSVRLNCFCL